MPGGRLAGARVLARRLAGSWYGFWFAPLDPGAVALFRVLLGTVLAALLLAQGPDWERLYGPAGILPLDEPVMQAYPRHQLSLLALGEEVVPAAAFWWLGLAMCLALAAGVAGRAAAAGLFVLVSSGVFRSPAALSGEDFVARLALLPAAFATLDTRWSLRAWWRRRRGRAPLAPGPVWPVRLIQIHTVLIYVFTMRNRLASDPTWWSGEAMYWVLVSTTWSAWPWPEATYTGAATRLATWTVLALEGLFPVAACWRRTRRPAALALIALHVAAAVALRGVLFFSLMMVCPLALFLGAERGAAAAREAGADPGESDRLRPSGLRAAG